MSFRIKHDKYYDPIEEKPWLISTPVGDVQRFIVCAANRREDGFIIAGARHWDNVMRNTAKMMDAVKEASRWEQGFIDQFGHFLTREEAAEIVTKNEQSLRSPIQGNKLFSENLY